MTSIEYTYNDNVLNVNGKQIDFPARIKKVIVVKEHLLIFLGFSLSRNIFLYDDKGNKIWQVEKGTPKRGPVSGEDPYTSVDASCVDGENVFIGAFGDGYDYKIDFKTGKVTRTSNVYRR